MDYHFNETALHMLQVLNQAGFESWFVGGCVRDIIRKKPFNDYDIATRAKPADVIGLFSKKFELDQKGRRYGCVRVCYEGIWYDITSLRKDVNQDGRRTGIVYTDDLKEDASRRDFTVNALYWNQNGFVDFFNGQQDLAEHRVCFIGDASQRVHEDYLRILRFLRFSSRYADEFDEEGVKACYENREFLCYLSGERVWDEWEKILFQTHTQRVLCLMVEKEIDMTLFGGKFDLQHYDAYQGRDSLLLTRLLLPFIHSEHLAQRLSLDFKQKLWLKVVDGLFPSENFRELYLKHGEKTKELVWYWAAKYKKDAQEIFQHSFWQVKDPQFPLTGQDILNLGCQPGPIVGDYLERARLWWVKNDFIPSYEDCLNYAKSLLNP